MVYKPSPRFKSTIEGPCEKIRTTNRPLSIGANIEQKPWKPTVRKGQIAGEYIPGKPSYKTLPPYFGPHVIDSKKRSAPAYSLGKRIIRTLRQADIGPNKFDIRGLCNKGLQTAPAFTLKSRRPDIKKFLTPSANKYSIGNSLKSTTKTIPKFSFGQRPVVIKTLPTPAPNVYHLPPVFGTAKESRIKAAPAFSMSGRPKPREIPAIIFPGPGDYESNYRYLQKLTPSFSIRHKHKIITDEHAKPGPAAYCPERYITHKSVPAPSFSIHHTPYLGVRKAYLIGDCKPATKAHWVL